METDVTLTPFSSTEVTLLLHWLAAPHVAAWYKDPEDHVAWAANPPPNGERALIALGGRPVGYIRWQTVSREVLDSVGLLIPKLGRKFSLIASRLFILCANEEAESAVRPWQKFQLMCKLDLLPKPTLCGCSFWKEPFLKNYMRQQVQDKGRHKSYQTKDSRLMKLKELRAGSAVEKGYSGFREARF